MLPASVLWCNATGMSRKSMEALALATPRDTIACLLNAPPITKTVFGARRFFQWKSLLSLVPHDATVACCRVVNLGKHQALQLDLSDDIAVINCNALNPESDFFRDLRLIDKRCVVLGIMFDDGTRPRDLWYYTIYNSYFRDFKFVRWSAVVSNFPIILERSFAFEGRVRVSDWTCTLVSQMEFKKRLVIVAQTDLFDEDVPSMECKLQSYDDVPDKKCKVINYYYVHLDERKVLEIIGLLETHAVVVFVRDLRLAGVKLQQLAKFIVSKNKALCTVTNQTIDAVDGMCLYYKLVREIS